MLPHLRLVSDSAPAEPAGGAQPTPPIESVSPALPGGESAEDGPTVHGPGAAQPAEPDDDAPTTHDGPVSSRPEAVEDAPTAHGAASPAADWAAPAADLPALPPADPGGVDLLDPTTAYLVAENRRLGRERDDARRSAARAAEEVRIALARAVAAEEAAAPAQGAWDALQRQESQLRAALKDANERLAAAEAELAPLRAFARAPWWVRLRGP